MCGRFILTESPDVLADLVGLDASWADGVGGFKPNYNVAPTHQVIAFRQRPEGTGREAVRLRWGLIPFWSKDEKIAYKLINARSETAPDKPSFRAAFKRRRCLVPADGFYEWKKSGKAKQPFCIRLRDDRPFAIAGLWEHWQGPDGQVVESCTLLTTEPNAMMAKIHDRMPVILDPADFDLWLDPGVDKADPLRPLLAPFDDKQMRAYEVSSRVGSPAANDPSCIAPV
ncbi:MAG: SOS response-associated peptidase [Pseudomonadota bacterium]